MQQEIKKNTNSKTKNRSLKIQPYLRLNRYSVREVPQIRLQGNWLQQAGFYPHQRVRITTLDKLLIISIDDQGWKL